MIEAFETVQTERNLLWQICLKLYNEVSNNGTIKADDYRAGMIMAGKMFEGQKLPLQHSMGWLLSVADFMVAMEKAIAQKVGPKDGS